MGRPSPVPPYSGLEVQLDPDALRVDPSTPYCLQYTRLPILLRPIGEQVVAAWGFANRSTPRIRRAVDDLDAPALRSTRNPLGVLAGGGEADLMDGESEEVTVPQRVCVTRRILACSCQIRFESGILGQHGWHQMSAN